MANEFKDTLRKLDTLGRDIRSWTASTMAAGTMAIDQLATDLEEQAAALMGAISKVKVDIQEASREIQKTVRAESAIRERAIRPYLAMGTPGVLA
eukprot:5103192-Lingulodinium_polyedra.AAC.1